MIDSPVVAFFLRLGIFLAQCDFVVPIVSIKDLVDKDRPDSETVLSPSDFKNIPEGELDLSRLGIHVPTDPTLGDRFEGDIILAEVKRLNDTPGVQRSAIAQGNRRWPNNEIPYTLSSQYGSYARSVIAKAMSEYHAKTCIRFVPRQNHRDYINIHPDKGCYSMVGRLGGRQPLSLDAGCLQTGVIMHELMHTVGFFHEQSRSDRDSYVEIVWQNLMRGTNDQFTKYSMTDPLGEAYDYGSIMHYGPRAFSSNGRATIIARKAGGQNMGQRSGFSAADLRKINRLYRCSGSGSNRRVTGTGTAAKPNGNRRPAPVPQPVRPNRSKPVSPVKPKPMFPSRPITQTRPRPMFPNRTRRVLPPAPRRPLPTSQYRPTRYVPRTAAKTWRRWDYYGRG